VPTRRLATPKRNIDDAEARLARLRELVKEGIDDLKVERNRLFAEKPPSVGKRRVPLSEIKKTT
jgi:hypothetical protein